MAKQMTPKEVVDLYLHKPDQSATNYVQWVEWMQAAPKIDYGCVLDKYLIPLHPGDLMAVIARPGHGKSSFMAYMAKRTADKIVERGETNKCVIYVSWEQSVEEIEAFFQSGNAYNSTDLAWGRVSLDTVKKQVTKRAALPIWMIGNSIKKADVKKPPLTIDVVLEAIRGMRYEYGYEPVLVCFDYLQIIPVKGGSNRFEQVSEATIKTKQLAMEIGVPIIAGVQASRAADSRAGQIPAMSDAQHSSAIEQTADKQMALFRPIKIMEQGEGVTIAGSDYTVDDGLLIFRLLKQRFDVGSGTWPVQFEPQTLTMQDYQTYEMEKHTTAR